MKVAPMEANPQMIASRNSLKLPTAGNATAVNSQILTSGNSQIMTTSGNSQIMTTSGNSQILTTGNSQIMTTSGNSQIMTTTGNPQMMTTGSLQMNQLQNFLKQEILDGVRTSDSKRTVLPTENGAMTPVSNLVVR